MPGNFYIRLLVALGLRVDTYMDAQPLRIRGYHPAALNPKNKHLSNNTY